MRIYLDNCCVGRPSDDQRQERIRLETEAIRVIIKNVRDGVWLWIGSDIFEVENEANEDAGKREFVESFMLLQHSRVSLSDHDIVRANELERLGFKEFDSYHVAAAESGKCNVLLTTDDRFLNTAHRNRTHLKVTIKNPVDWILEQMQK